MNIIKSIKGYNNKSKMGFLWTLGINTHTTIVICLTYLTLLFSHEFWKGTKKKKLFRFFGHNTPTNTSQTQKLLSSDPQIYMKSSKSSSSS